MPVTLRANSSARNVPQQRHDPLPHLVRRFRAVLPARRHHQARHGSASSSDAPDVPSRHTSAFWRVRPHAPRRQPGGPVRLHPHERDRAVRILAPGGLRTASRTRAAGRGPPTAAARSPAVRHRQGADGAAPSGRQAVPPAAARAGRRTRTSEGRGGLGESGLRGSVFGATCPPGPSTSGSFRTGRCPRPVARRHRTPPAQEGKCPRFVGAGKRIGQSRRGRAGKTGSSGGGVQAGRTRRKRRSAPS